MKNNKKIYIQKYIMFFGSMHEFAVFCAVSLRNIKDSARIAIVSIC